jgi:hypothetical protein
MARMNDPEIFLQRARECEALAATSAEPFARDILLQMAEGYWIMLSATDSHNEIFLSQRKAPDS